jgi:hypothetical protein
MRFGAVTLVLLVGCVNLTRPEDLRDWSQGKADATVAADGAAPDRVGPGVDGEGTPASADAAGTDVTPADAAGTDVGGTDTAVAPDTAPLPPDAAPDKPTPPPDVAVVPDTPPVPAAGTPTLHWRFDDPSGTVASDSSGNGYHGTYYGLSGDPPVTSNLVPTVKFTNPASRAFTASQRHQVRLYNPPAALMPTNSVTATAWFRTRTIDSSNYSLILNVADGYFITLAQGQIWAARGVAASRHEYCTANVTGFIDGSWHHVAAVWAPTGMKVYLDGTERCTSGRGDALVYDPGLGILVGRRSNAYPYQFDGNLDDVRVYARVLSPEQIQALASGAQ